VAEREIIERHIDQSAPIKKFGSRIENVGGVIQTLREDLYENPIRIVCQEYACNARDSHRAAGKPDCAIEITLPTLLSPTYKVQDWGTGISPKMFEEVFLAVGTSTKNKDETQTGCFGIGSKSGWAYGDSFTIETVTDFVRRVYIGYVENDNCGSFSLVDETPCQEQNGTTILIPVKQADIEAFEKWTYYVTRYWNPQPLVVNGKPEEMHLPTPYLQGDGWCAASVVGKEAESRNGLAIVDGIPYEINASAITGLDATYARKADRIRTLLNCPDMAIVFSTGEVQIAASREGLKYTDRTNKALLARVNAILLEIPKLLTKKLEGSVNLWHALCTFHEIQNNTYSVFTDASRVVGNQFFENVQWKGVPVGYDAFDKEVGEQANSRYYTTQRFTLGRNYFKEKLDVGGFGIKSSPGIVFRAGSLICIADAEDGKIKARVDALFDLYPTVKIINVLSWRKGTEPPKIEEWKTQFNVDQMSAILFSQIEPKTQPKIAKKSAGYCQGVTYWKFNSSQTGYNIEKLTAAIRDQGGYYLVRTGKMITWCDQIENAKGTLDLIRKYNLAFTKLGIDVSKIPIVAIPSHQASKLTDKWIRLDRHIDQSIRKLATTMGVLWARVVNLHRDSYSRIFSYDGRGCYFASATVGYLATRHTKFEELANALDRLRMHQDRNTWCQLVNYSRRFCKDVIQAETWKELIEMMEEALKRYPLLVDIKGCSDSDTISKDLRKRIAQYVDLIEEQLARTHSIKIKDTSFALTTLGLKNDHYRTVPLRHHGQLDQRAVWGPVVYDHTRPSVVYAGFGGDSYEAAGKNLRDSESGGTDRKEELRLVLGGGREVVCGGRSDSSPSSKEGTSCSPRQEELHAVDQVLAASS